MGNTTFNPQFDFTPTVSSAVSAGGSLIGSVVGSISQAVQNKQTRDFNREEAEKQRLWNEKMYNEQNAWNMEMWNKTNEYNTPENQVNRLREAGLNPLFYGLDGSSASSMSSAQPLGYERAQADNQPNPFGSSASDIASAGQLLLQGKSVQKDIELKNAQIDKLKQEESGLKLDNEFKDKTMEARVEGEKLANSLTKENMREIDSRIKKNAQDVKESIERTNNEIEKRGLIIAEKILTSTKNREIVEMLPYNKLLASAQTQAQRAAASLSWAHAAIQNGLLEAGYVDSFIEDLKQSARGKSAAADSAEVTKAINDFKLAIRNGNLFDSLSTFTDNSLGDFFGDVLSSAFQMFSIASEAIGGGLSGVMK